MVVAMVTVVAVVVSMVKQVGGSARTNRTG
jgi:hypothetical protein